MGCSSGNASEEKGFQKTGDPKKDFFYCFDAQEIQIIEEKRLKPYLLLKRIVQIYIVDSKLITQKKKMKI